MKALLNRPNLVFAYLFFALFVFSALALLVSDLSSTFSRLFAIYTQQDGIYDVFSRSFYLLGFFITLCALILSSWNQKESLSMRFVLLGFGIAFVFIFALDIFYFYSADSLIETILKKEQIFGFKELLATYLDEFLIIGFFYGAFVFLPLICMSLKLVPNQKHWIGKFFSLAQPSVNIVIYTLMGCAMQSYWHKDYLWCYADLVALCLSLLLLIWVFFKRGDLFGSYERINLFLLIMGLLIFGFSSDLLQTNAFVARYSFFLCAFVAWCAEWMFAYVIDKENKV